uniref:Uncharacterized protein n=1 Tax=Spongospora subterranea TaxID=70186 RepID=A0A0H5R884_9EUKA|eukprot:CRZ04529.1 hypothetical protein [Spongospora subterranea]
MSWQNLVKPHYFRSLNIVILSAAVLQRLQNKTTVAKRNKRRREAVELPCSDTAEIPIDVFLRAVRHCLASGDPVINVNDENWFPETRSGKKNLSKTVNMLKSMKPI